MSRNPATRRYDSRVIQLSLAYAVALIGAKYGFKYHVLNGLLGYVAAIGRYLVEEQDEYLRNLMVRQTLWASGFALSIATIWGFLESFDLAPHVESYYIAVLWFGGLGLGACINKLTIGRGA
jgi:hypothetical protein